MRVIKFYHSNDEYTIEQLSTKNIALAFKQFLKELEGRLDYWETTWQDIISDEDLSKFILRLQEEERARKQEFLRDKLYSRIEKLTMRDLKNVGEYLDTIS